jgi:hypothetical protein
LRKHNEVELKQVVLKLQNFRNPLASETRHPLYQAQPERWLQSSVQQDVTRVDVSPLPEQVYEQVFAQTVAQHGILDLLGITRAGRLAILELKTTEDPDLEFLRPEMRRSHPHRPGRELASRPPRDDAPVMPSAPHKYSPCSEATLRYDSAFSHLTD